MHLYGKEIYNQLITLGRNSLLTWAARNYRVFDEKSFTQNLEYHRGGLFFQVSGLLHKQKVMVRLQGNDLYHVEVGNIVKGSWKKKQGTKSYTDIYFDSLIDCIDDLVEGTLNKTPEEARKIYEEANVLY